MAYSISQPRVVYGYKIPDELPFFTSQLLELCDREKLYYYLFIYLLLKPTDSTELKLKMLHLVATKI